MNLGTRLLTWLRGEYVGIDSLGNRYYRDKRPRALLRGGGRASREKRWVVYAGEPEGSKVPPEWHAWLHHTVRRNAAAGARAPAIRGKRSTCRT